MAEFGALGYVVIWEVYLPFEFGVMHLCSLCIVCAEMEKMHLLLAEACLSVVCTDFIKCNSLGLCQLLTWSLDFLPF